MPVVNVNLLVDEKTYAGVKAGVLELCGMAKNVDNKRVAKHIPAVADAAKEGAAKAIDFIRVHKKGAIIAGGVLIVGGVQLPVLSDILQPVIKESVKNNLPKIFKPI